LRVSLAAARDKLAQLDERTRRAATVRTGGRVVKPTGSTSTKGHRPRRRQSRYADTRWHLRGYPAACAFMPTAFSQQTVTRLGLVSQELTGITYDSLPPGSAATGGGAESPNGRSAQKACNERRSCGRVLRPSGAGYMGQ
jgi:hypothetical protein